MKTRSSSGVGTKVELDFDMNSLRITDAGEDEQQNGYGRKPSSSIIESIKNKTTVASNENSDAPKVTADVQSNKLKQMLAGLKANK